MVRLVRGLFLLLLLMLPGIAIRVDSSGWEPHFRDVTAAIGLDFRHDPHAGGQYLMPEIMGSGGALLDYDGDGDLDLFLVQGMDRGSAKRPAGRLVTSQATGAVKVGHRLYRNELLPTGKLTLTDVSARAGIDKVSYGMGVAVGDIDGDGDPDLVVTGDGPNLLCRNNADGTFTEVGKESGIDDPR